MNSWRMGGVLLGVAMTSALSGCGTILGIEEPYLADDGGAANGSGDAKLADGRGADARSNQDASVVTALDGQVTDDVALPGDDANTGSEAAPGAEGGTAPCAADTKRCGGQCVALDDATYGCGATSCDNKGCPDPGAGALVCEAGACVIGSCGDGKKKCGSACVSVDDPRYGCGLATCAACADVAGATLVCRGGACGVGTCASGAKKCGDACVATGDVNYGCGPTTCEKSSCPTAGTGTLGCQAGACVVATCGAGTKKCTGKCVAVDDPTYGCGPTTCDATLCPVPGAGTLVCSGGACVIGTCGAGTKKCGSKCVPVDRNNGCADAAKCTACAANETCVGSPSQCTCVANDTEACAGKTCGTAINNCGTTVSCGACTAPQTCNGGGVANKCGCTPVNPCTGGKCGTGLSDQCGGAVNCTCSGTNTCGGGTTAGVCGCTKKTCAGLCGAQSDGCGGTLQCTPCCVPKTCATGQCGTVSNGCSGTMNCPTTCPGTGQSCGGGGTPNVCGCTDDNAAACSGKPCQAVTNNCGKTVTCPNTCTVRPETVASCQNNQCTYGCPAGATPLSCTSSSAPACGLWRFESAGATVGWSIEGTTDPNAWDGTPLSVKNGALAVPFSIPTDGTATWLLVRLQLCPGGQTQELKGKRVSARVRFDLTPAATPANDFSYLQMYPTTTPGQRIDYEDPFAFGQWYTLQGDVTAFTLSTTIDIAATIHVKCKGIMYIDDVSIVPTP